jgi:GNAT superfamily N-acetyltransferase
MNIKIVPLDKNFLEEAICLVNEVFPRQDKKENADTSFRASLDHEKYKEILSRWKIPKLEYFLVLDTDKNIVVGTSGIYEMDNDPTSAWLGWTSVDPKYRRKHIGEAIVTFCLEESRRRGYKMMELHTVDIKYQYPAHRLYEKLGFKLIRRGPEKEIGHDRLYYEKVL